MNASAEELYALLIPLANDRLLVPRACVAEVIRFQAPEPAAGSAPWYLGDASWNGRPLSLASFERTMSDTIPDVTNRTRVVVFYSVVENSKNGYFGILTQGFPQLVRINNEVLEVDDTEQMSADIPVFCKVRMINEYPLIPNLEMLETMLAEEAEAQ